METLRIQLDTLRNKEVDSNVGYIQHAYQDVLQHLTMAMSEYEIFRMTGDFDVVKDTRNKFDEAVLALSDLSEAVSSFIPPKEIMNTISDET